MRFILFLIIFATENTYALDRYFANEEVQKLAPEAFALNNDAYAFHKNLDRNSKWEQEKFIQILQSDAVLLDQIHNFPTLSWDIKIAAMKQVFSYEVEALGVVAPELIIDSISTKNEAYFDFDNEKGGTGRVLLNIDELKKDENPYAPLLLLIHETKHSSQFQQAFKNNDVVAKSFKAAFIAQKKFSKEIVSFSDFLTLNNEYEAFQFSNYVLGRILNGKIDTLGMGTYASQFNVDLTPKIDLLKIFELLKETNSNESVLNIFNKAEKAQYDILMKK